LNGPYALIRMKDGGWLLKKGKGASSPSSAPREGQRSVKTGRTMEEIRKDGRTPRSEGALGRAAMPRCLKPELATLVDAPPEGPGWLHEVKLDGYRMLARVEGGQVSLRTRNGKDWAERLAERLSALTSLPDGFYDGELVVYDADGRTNFEA